MTLPKIILILGSGAVIAGVGAFLMWGNFPLQGNDGGTLLKDYQEFLEDLKGSKTKTNLSDSCEKPEKFANQIKDLEERLSDLQKRKSDFIGEKDDSQFIPELPELPSDEFIPELPELDDGSKVPELSGDEFVPELPNEEFIPELPELNDGSKPLELSDEDFVPELPSDEFIPELPELDDGSKVPELSGGDFVPELPELPSDEFIPELPELDDGSKPLDLSDGDYFDSDQKKINVLNEINKIEKQIILELNNLKSLCDKEEVTSTSCPEACKKYSDCAEYTEGVTAEDIKDAYDSCMEECAKWSDKTKICINKKRIKEPLDCRDLSFCVLPEYGGPGVEILK